jgi:branched-subunit amino acid ABC-type transport system permease component
MFDPGFWAGLAKAEWTAVAAAPLVFVGTVVVGWLIGWAIMRAWYRRAVQNEKDHHDKAWWDYDAGGGF